MLGEQDGTVSWLRGNSQGRCLHPGEKRSHLTKAAGGAEAGQWGPCPEGLREVAWREGHKQDSGSESRGCPCPCVSPGASLTLSGLGCPRMALSSLSWWMTDCTQPPALGFVLPALSHLLREPGHAPAARDQGRTLLSPQGLLLPPGPLSCTCVPGPTTPSLFG